jgi:hypothetical protein
MYSPSNVYNGTLNGRYNRDSRAALPTNKLKGNSQIEDCSGSKLHWCKRFSTICIPKVETTLSKEYIYKKLCSFNIGRIDRIIEVPLRNDPTHKRLIIKLHWHNESQVKSHLEEHGDIKLVYDMPWYWKVYECTN